MHSGTVPSICRRKKFSYQLLLFNVSKENVSIRILFHLTVCCQWRKLFFSVLFLQSDRKTFYLVTVPSTCQKKKGSIQVLFLPHIGGKRLYSGTVPSKRNFGAVSCICQMKKVSSQLLFLLFVRQKKVSF